MKVDFSLWVNIQWVAKHGTPLSKHSKMKLNHWLNIILSKTLPLKEFGNRKQTSPTISLTQRTCRYCKHMKCCISRQGRSVIRGVGQNTAFSSALRGCCFQLAQRNALGRGSHTFDTGMTRCKGCKSTWYSIQIWRKTTKSHNTNSEKRMWHLHP